MAKAKKVLETAPVEAAEVPQEVVEPKPKIDVVKLTADHRAALNVIVAKMERAKTLLEQYVRDLTHFQHANASIYAQRRLSEVQKEISEL